MWSFDTFYEINTYHALNVSLTALKSDLVIVEDIIKIFCFIQPVTTELTEGKERIPTKLLTQLVSLFF